MNKNDITINQETVLLIQTAVDMYVSLSKDIVDGAQVSQSTVDLAYIFIKTYDKLNEELDEESGLQ